MGEPDLALLALGALALAPDPRWSLLLVLLSPLWVFLSLGLELVLLPPLPLTLLAPPTLSWPLLLLGASASCW